MVVALGGRPRRAELLRIEPPRAAEVGDIEERRLDTEHPTLFGRVLPDAEQKVPTQGWRYDE